MNVPEEFKFRQEKVSSDSAESEVTNDVRYQEFTEITLGLKENVQVKGYFFFVSRRRGGVFCYIRISLPV